jgi:hypothetical protein
MTILLVRALRVLRGEIFRRSNFSRDGCSIVPLSTVHSNARLALRRWITGAANWSQDIYFTYRAIFVIIGITLDDENSERSGEGLVTSNE